MMKRDWLLFSFVLSQLVPLTFAPASAQTGWVQQSCPVSTNLTGVDFVDRDNGWICGDSGTILHTTDGGRTWVQQDLGSTWDVTDIDFVDLDNGYAVGAMSTIWRTTDGGETWTVIDHFEQTPPKTSVFVVDPSTVWVTGYSEEPGGPLASICVTTNAGAVWECGFVAADHGTVACDVMGFSAQTAFISCNIRRYDNSMYSVLYKTTNAGGSFEGVTWLSAPNQEVQFLGERIGFYGPRWEVPGGDMKTTTDGGATWTSRFLDGDVLPAHMAFASATLGWLAGMDGYIAMTTDGGATWVQQATGTNRGLYRIQFEDASVGTAVGEAGMILHTITGGMSGADVAGDPSSASLRPLFARPNPSTGPVLIAYRSLVTGPARIEIFDVHGRAVRELTLPSVEGRRQEILWDGRDVSGHLAAPGAYFLRLTVDGATTATHRLTLAR